MKKKKRGSVLTVFLIVLVAASAALLGYCILRLTRIKNSYDEADEAYMQIEARLFSDREPEQDGAIPPDALVYGSQPAQTDRPWLTGTGMLNTPEAAMNARTEEETIPVLIREEATVTAEAPGTVPEETPMEAERDGSGTKMIPGGAAGSMWHPADGSILPFPEWLFSRASLPWNYGKALHVCSDIVGYIYQDGTKISYPVVQAGDNDRYLRHLINGEYSISGTIFVDYRCRDGLDGRFSIVYGHNMDDGSMLGSITAYKDKGYYDEHPSMELYIGNGMYRYYVYSAFTADVRDDIVNTYDFSDGMFTEALAELRSRRGYEMDSAPEADTDSRIVLLATCTEYPRDYDYRYCVALIRGERLMPHAETQRR